MARRKIQHQGIANVVGDYEPSLVNITWIYDSEYPWSIQLIVFGDRPVMRLVSRDLLNCGVSQPTGDTNLWIGPKFFDQPAKVRFLIHIADGLTMQLDMKRDNVICVLDEVERLVPFGTEAQFQDWDGGLALCEGAA